jgi:hypothetical protein
MVTVALPSPMIMFGALVIVMTNVSSGSILRSP